MGSFNVSEEIPRLVYMKAPPPAPTRDTSSCTIHEYAVSLFSDGLNATDPLRIFSSLVRTKRTVEFHFFSLANTCLPSLCTRKRLNPIKYPNSLFKLNLQHNRSVVNLFFASI